MDTPSCGQIFKTFKPAGGTLAFIANQLTLSAAAPTIIAANGNPTNGNGGSISLTETGTSTITLGTGNGQVSLSADGGTAGLGAMPFINGLANSTPATPVPVNTLIQVSAGSSVTTGFDGSISINGVLCQQWLTGNASAPSYWDCVNPTSPGAESIVATTVPSLKSSGVFGASNVQIFVMSDVKAWQSFFAAQANPGNPTNLIGFYGLNTINSPNLVTSVFSNVITDAGGDETPNAILPATTANQVGNQLDSILGGTSQSSAWQTSYTLDTTSTGTGYINGTHCVTVFNTATCNTYPTDTNWQIFQALFPSTASAIFYQEYEHNTTNSAGALLENALTYLPDLNSQVVALLDVPTSCSTVSTTGVFPNKQFWWCASAINSPQEDPTAGGLTGLRADAQSKLMATPSQHQFFVFDNIGAYSAYCSLSTGLPPAPALPCSNSAVPAGASGHTYNNAGAVYDSIVLINRADQTQLGTSLANSMAHEAGHQLDHLYCCGSTMPGTIQNASEVGSLFELNLTICPFSE